ncbi:MAG: ABC transporter permease, partial [Candidatus Cloacimonadota bacterium]|nr:ABC transporter permease [Candidatus Cloacimonadota bacterium]
GATVGYYTQDPWLALLAAGVFGSMLGLLHAVASVSLAADQVVSGIAINFLGSGLALFFSRIFFDGATMTKAIDLNNKIPRPLHGIFPERSFLYYLLDNQYATTFLAFLAVFVMWFVLNKTVIGLRIKAVGEKPAAADSLGINVLKIRYGSVITSGFLAGIGGAAMSLAIVSNFRPTLISGHGFIALAAMIFGHWKPVGALLACLLFGFAQGMSVYLGQFDISLPSQFIDMLPYVVTILVLVYFVGNLRAPAADGKPFEKEQKF